MEINKYVIIGGVAAGASVAPRLRRLDEFAQIIMIDKGNHVSFSNCSLPYRLSDTVEKTENLILMNPQKFKNQYDVDVRVNQEVITIDEENKEIKVKNLVTNEEYQEKYDKLIVAPGAKAIVPNFEGLDKVPNFTLKTVNDVQKIVDYTEQNIVKKISVIGGGFIGIETAENLQKKGYEVTIIQGINQLLAPFDFEMSLYANKALREKNIKLLFGSFVSSFEKNKIILANGNEIATDLVILSIGVKPETEFLKSTSIKMQDTGHVIVNENYQTTNKDIYAAGDAIVIKNQLTSDIHPLALAGPANKQGRLIADHINGRTIKNKGYIGSSIIKIFDWTLASTGLNEKALKNSDFDYDTTYGAPLDRVSLMPGAELLFSKILFEKVTGKILGLQIASKGRADKRVDVLATAIKAEMTVFDLADLELCYAPTYSTGKDAINKLGYQASEIVLEQYKKINFTQVYELDFNKVEIIDVREKIEYEKEHLKVSKNIPMSEFRNRLDEIDKSKKIYVHCQSGQRSYNVTLALKQRGYDVYNISGSFVFLKQYEEEMKQQSENFETVILK